MLDRHFGIYGISGALYSVLHLKFHFFTLYPATGKPTRCLENLLRAIGAGMVFG